jgi:heptaprenylglycerol acetyltransferase
MASELVYEDGLRAVRNRVYQVIARLAPGSSSLRIWLHRKRGVTIGTNVFIGTDVILDTSLPRKISIGNNVVVGMRTTLIGHFGSFGAEHVRSRKPSLIIEDDVFIGPSVTVLPNIRIGKGSVIMAGSVVTKSVVPGTLVRGNPAEPVGLCGIPLLQTTPMWEFYRNLRPIPKKRPASS